MHTNDSFVFVMAMCRHVIDSEKTALIVEMVSLLKVDSLANTEFVTHEK